VRFVAAIIAALAALGGRPLALPHPLPHRTLAVPILMYHRVGALHAGEPAITRALTVPTRAFAAEMTWLHDHDFHAITPVELFAALEHGASLPAKPVMITFDDGYRDVLWNAAPVLHRLRMPATAFIITGRISNGDPSFLTWTEVRRLEARDFSIGSHTVHHLELTLLAPKEAFVELVASRRALEEHLHRPVPWFAYPSGRVDAALLPLVRKAGYVLAMTTAGGDLQRADRPFLLRRDPVYAWTGVKGLASLLG
jgi:peptidoglycan/xylan/chitin deacetylase (PgdA/CDA1 family)